MKKIYFKSFITALLLLCSTVASAQTFEDWTSTNTEHGSTSSFTYYFSDDSKSVTFDWSVSSEDNWDWLIVTIDGTQVLKKSGIASGTYTHTFTATGSSHILEVKYTKDNSGSSGSDKAKIYNIKYSRGGWCGTNATWLLTDGTLIIDGTGAMEDFYFDNPDRDVPWPCSVLKNVIIGDDITYIGNWAFRYCENLTSITIGNSVTTIGYNAFYGCTGLTNITIPNSVTSIESRAFYGCTGLTSVTVPNSVIRIEDNAFYDTAWYNNQADGVVYLGKMLYKYKGTMPANTSITIKDGTLGINNSAFYDCSGLTSVTIPNSVTSIGSYAFCNCSGLKSVTIPNSVTEIGSSAFHSCTGLKSVTIPNSVTEIGTRAFNNCDGLTSVTIGNSVTSIGSYAFCNCSGLTSVTIPNSVTEIGDWAFCNCSGLTSVTIGNSVTSIRGGAFSDCTGLRIVYNNSSLDITAGSSNHGSVAYYANAVITPNSNMQSDFIFKTTDGKHTLTGYIGNDSIISLPENYNGENYSIGNAVFQNNKNITSITIPNSVISIGEKAFYNCTGLTSVTIPNSVISIESSAFYGCTGLTSVTIGNSVTSIGNEAFRNCTGLTSVTIGNSVTSIGNSAFSGCTKLTAVHISDLSAWCKIDFGGFEYNPLYYAKNLYLNGEKITNLVIPSDITEIKDYAFYNCTGLTSVTIGNSVTSIGNEAFRNCTRLTSVTIGNSVTSIGNSAFSGCTKLTAVHISDLSAWCKIDFGGFEYNPLYYAKNLYLNGEKITNLVIPSDITEIKDYAFYNCTGLTSVTIGNSVTSIGNYAFSGCTGLRIVYNNSSLNITAGSSNHGNVAYYANIIVTKDDDIKGDFIFRTADNTNTLIAYAGNDSVITLPENYNDENYAIGEKAFRNCAGLTNVTIPNSVTTIGNSAFFGCIRLNSVTIPESVEEIEANAFKGCTSITEIYSMAEVPAVITETSFHNYSATLYVPYGAKRLYKITDGWSNFTNIVEMEPVEDPEEERLVGDVDGDGSIDIADVTALVEIILGTK